MALGILTGVTTNPQHGTMGRESASTEPVRSFLIRKFEEIERRMLFVLDQLNEEQLIENEASNSAANLIVHICGNIEEGAGG